MGALICGRHRPAPNAVRSRLTLAASTKMGSTLTVTNAAMTGLIVRKKVTVTEDCAYLKLDFHNWLYPPDSSTQPFTVNECVLESGTNANVLAVTFGGSASAVVAANTAGVVSDPIYPWKMGTALFVAGMVLWVRIRITMTSGMSFPGCTRSFLSGESVWQYNPSTATPQTILQSGTYGFSAGSLGTDYTGLNGTYEPVVVGLRSSTTSRAAVVLVGDSEVDREPCYVQSAAVAANNALLTICHGGRSQTDLYNNQVWAYYLRYASVLIDDHGTNAMTDLTSEAVYWAIARTTYGYSRLYHVGLYPQSSSTDGWATAGNQSVSGFTATQIASFESYITSKVSDGTLDGQYRPTSASTRDAGNTALWKTNGTPGTYTTDGLHTTATGEAALVTEFTPVFAGWMSGLAAPLS